MNNLSVLSVMCFTDCSHFWPQLMKQNASDTDSLRGHVEKLVSILQSHQPASAELKARVESLDE
jgi:hypothetical protein